MKRIKSAIEWKKVVQSAESIRINELEVEIKRLKKIIEQKDKQAQQKERKLKRRIKKLTSTVKSQKIRIKKLKATASKEKIVPAKRTKAQYMAEQHTTWIDRFINRLVEDQIDLSTREGENYTPAQKLDQIRLELLSWSPEQVYDFMVMTNLESAYYDSDGTRAHMKLNGNYLYDAIVGN